MMARAVTLLPEPDSPTSARVSPASSESEISRTAAAGPRAEKLDREIFKVQKRERYWNTDGAGKALEPLP